MENGVINRRRWHYYALGTIVLWASAYVFTKVALRNFSPIPLGFLRCAIASIALLTVLALKKELWPARLPTTCF